MSDVNTYNTISIYQRNYIFITSKIVLSSILLFPFQTFLIFLALSAPSYYIVVSIYTVGRKDEKNWRLHDVVPPWTVVLALSFSANRA